MYFVRSLSTCPSEETLVETPSGLKFEFMRHQKRILAWLQWSVRLIIDTVVVLL